MGFPKSPGNGGVSPSNAITGDPKADMERSQVQVTRFGLKGSEEVRQERESSQ